MGYTVMQRVVTPGEWTYDYLDSFAFLAKMSRYP